jgi:hypothetical protein
MRSVSTMLLGAHATQRKVMLDKSGVRRAARPTSDDEEDALLDRTSVSFTDDLNSTMHRTGCTLPLWLDSCLIQEHTLGA